MRKFIVAQREPLLHLLSTLKKGCDPMVKRDPDILDKLIEKYSKPTKQELKAKQEELLSQISNKPLTFCFPQKHPKKIEDNIDFIDILTEFAKDPNTDKSFFISEKQQKFLDNYDKHKNEVKHLLWLRFFKTFNETPLPDINDYELLFGLLTFVLPMQYAHRVAKCLLDEYETLENVLLAPAEELHNLLSFNNSTDVLMLLDLLYALLRKCAAENNP